MFNDLKQTISADSLFHFTNSFDKLISILKNEFAPRYSLEDFKHFTKFPNIVRVDKIEEKEYEKAVPMVCFCDIPLSQIKNHIYIYGGYGLGLKKEWGKSKGLNPVMYVEPDSLLTKLITHNLELTMWNQFNPEDVYSQFDEYYIDSSMEEASKAIVKLDENNTQVLCYSKQYEGVFWKAEQLDIKDKKYRYYDEREWRYVPLPAKLKELGLPSFLSYSDFFNEDVKDRYHNLLMEREKLSFEPNDIKYIFVKDDKEVLKMVESLKRIKGKFSPEEITLLTTRIITLEQIKKDF